ncbi:PAS domain-containing sensor histidine kinase [Fundidesulfovibrio magnetotacticus]|nr:sensor histidine kinase [Fundidesulfovibrio magnetotacticus]
MSIPRGRSGLDDLLACHETLRRRSFARALDAVPVVVFVLCATRQIVLANAQARQASGRTMSELLGMRPGEAFDCIHAHLEEDGCGASEFCTRCGAVQTILRGLSGENCVKECSLLRRGGHGVEAVDLQVSSRHVELDGQSYVVFTVQDQGDVKRRRTLERLFFHDVLNTAGGLTGLMGLLREDLPESFQGDARFIHSTLEHLVEELKAQKDLLAAENNELEPVFVALNARTLLGDAARLGASLPQAEGGGVRVEASGEDARVQSDPVLLKRVLGNMVKNAVEASRAGDVVRLWCESGEGVVRFRVANPAVMSEDVRLRVFKRNFSTKGKGRGLGAYGMRLLGERYLGGRVGFTSRAPEGTVFTLELPCPPAS